MISTIPITVIIEAYIISKPIVCDVIAEQSSNLTNIYDELLKHDKPIFSLKLPKQTLQFKSHYETYFP